MPITARQLYFTFMLIVIAAFSPVIAQANNQAGKPNIVFVLVDDLGWTDLSCQGSEYYSTPNIDKLAKSGVRFTNAYAACAVCSPTRAAVMTGQYPARTGITDWIRARFQGGQMPKDGKNPSGYQENGKRPLLTPRNPLWLELEQTTIAELLKANGYTTCHIGKWHLGMEPHYPEHQGFDYNFGGCDYGQPPSYFDPYTNRRLKQGIPTLKPRKEGEYLTDREADEASNFITKYKDKPFFLYLANYAVHTPIQAKQKLTDHYKQKPTTNQKNAKYAAMVHSVDEAVGQVMKTLEQHKLTENTIVVFTSDNGGLLGPTHNAPLRSGKGFPYEGGIRVPLIVSYPAKIKPGQVSHEPVTSVDYLPTLAELTHTPVSKNLTVDGVSIAPHLLSSTQQPIKRDKLLWHFPHYRGKIVPYSIIRSGDYKLIKYYEGPAYELFNLKDDLSEKKNLAEQMPEKVKQLDQQLQVMLKGANAKIPKIKP